MSRATIADEAALAPADGFDAVAHVSRSLARVPWTWEVEVLLHLPLARATELVPPTLAELAAVDGRTLLRIRVESLDWMASLLAGLGCDFTVRRPDELRASIGDLVGRLLAARDGAE
jgi:predicted DNA-binding transcriptional regulator YafY